MTSTSSRLNAPSGHRGRDGTIMRRTAAAAALLAMALAVGVGAPQAATGVVPVANLKIVGTPKLYVERPGAGGGYDSAWVVLQTSSHLHVVRQILVTVRDLVGESYSTSGAPNCVRSTILQGNRVVQAGRRYGVQVYGRANRSAKEKRLLGTYTLAAHRFDTPRKHPSSPNCGS